MSGYLLVLITLLAGQVNSANDPYGPTDESQPASGRQPAQQNGDSLVPILEAPPDDSRTRPGITPPARSNADPYGASTAAPTGSQPGVPFGGRATSPSSSHAPPPGFTGFQSQSTPPTSTAPPANIAAALKPSALMRAMLTPPAASRLTGESISLTEVVAGAASRAEQSQRIEAYWDLCSSVADYYLGLGEQDELRRLRSSVSRIGPTWDEAEKELAVRIGTSERAARASQQRLASWAGSLRNLPLPGDMPHCGNYHPYYDEIFAGRPNQEAQELSAVLPLRYAELRDAAAAVRRAEEWLTAIATVRNENSDGTGTLRALELWALRRRAFVQIARDYNRRIARYSELATPGPLPAERLVGMLILRETPATAVRPSSSGSSPNRQSSNSGRSVPTTFSGGWYPAAPGAAASVTLDNEVKPASADSQSEPRQERSLLVKPKWDR